GCGRVRPSWISAARRPGSCRGVGREGPPVPPLGRGGVCWLGEGFGLLGRGACTADSEVGRYGAGGCSWRGADRPPRPPLGKGGGVGGEGRVWGCAGGVGVRAARGWAARERAAARGGVRVGRPA